MLKRGADPISEILYPKALMPEEFAAAEAAINNTANTQPILAATEAGLYNILTKRGLKADSFIGHSFGELVALWADGVMDYETLIAMARERGSLMSEADPNAAMMACMTDKATLTAACQGIEKAYADGSRVFVEVGNGKVLSNLLKDCLAGKDYTAISLCPDKGKDTAESLEFALAQLAVLGIAVQDDPYRTPYNGDYVPKKSKTTYTVKMKSFVLPKHQEAMDAALLPDQRIIDMMKTAQEPKTIISSRGKCLHRQRGSVYQIYGCPYKPDAGRI